MLPTVVSVPSFKVIGDWYTSMWERLRLSNLVPDDRLAHQLVGEVEVALVPDNEVVQLDNFPGGEAHSIASRAPMSSMVSTARSVSFSQSWRDRSGIASQPISVITGNTIR